MPLEKLKDKRVWLLVAEIGSAAAGSVILTEDVNHIFTSGNYNLPSVIGSVSLLSLAAVIEIWRQN